MMANNIKEAPIQDINVKDSANKKNEIIIATITSISRITVEVAGEMCFSPLDHK